jgi:hypothetical protein
LAFSAPATTPSVRAWLPMMLRYVPGFIGAGGTRYAVWKISTVSA